MKKPNWPYSWHWTEVDELRLSGAARDLDNLASEISSIASTCCNEGKSSLSSELITDAGTHFEDELKLWKQKIDSDVVANLNAAAAAIRNTIEERKTLWDCYWEECRSFNEWAKENGEELIEFLF